ncbi:MAG: peptide chain release factor N(5)-glutamine methyltransferase [Bacteroidetes bacterium]|nr:peptide chain release factor N(5)-glutamine methyltransferase [Bacteroidota bacterium]MDA1336405.1 peptide chain release factor N(5)-glutamine methyltransferase [Bacteroidota bacterium]
MSETRAHRGQGPWPSNNTEREVLIWLSQRIQIDEVREREAIIRSMLMEVTGLSRGERISNPWLASESQLELLALWAERLNDHEPWQYIRGKVDFMGMEFQVDRRVLIPRPETEELIMLMHDRIPKSSHQLRILDIGTGSGIIPIAWKSKRPIDEVFGMDLSEEALQVAKANAAQLNQSVTWFHGDLFVDESIFDSGFDLIFSNPPYIPHREKESLAKHVTSYEPPMALFVDDGDHLKFYERIIEGCHKGDWLVKSGWLGLECHRDYVDEVLALIPATWASKEKFTDLQGNWRMILAQK